jgi:hypothetical protein
MLLEALILTVLFYLVVGNKILSSGNPWMCRNKIWTFTAPPISSNTTFKIESKVNDRQGLTDTYIVNILVKDTIACLSVSKITLLSLLIVKGKSQMNRETEVSEDPISLGHEQTVTVTALDTVTDEQIQSAAIDGIVIYPSGETKIFDDEESFHLLWKLVQIQSLIFLA